MEKVTPRLRSYLKFKPGPCSLAVDLRAAKAAAQGRVDGEKEAEGVKQVAFAGSAGSSSKVQSTLKSSTCSSMRYPVVFKTGGHKEGNVTRRIG